MQVVTIEPGLDIVPDFGQIVHSVAWYAMGLPLKVLYFNGPFAFGFGFWEGKSGEDICCQLTGVDSTFWMRNQDACVDILDRKYNAFALTIGAGIYLVSLLILVIKALRMCFQCRFSK